MGKKIFSPSTFNYINYLLLSLNYLSEGSGSCDVSTLAALCSSKVFNGRIVNYGHIIEYAHAIELVYFSSKRISLTEDGLILISLNKSNTFEITQEQKRFFANYLIFNGRWKSRFRNLFSSFSIHYEEASFILRTPVGELAPKFRQQIEILFALNIVFFLDDHVVVSHEYIKDVRNIRSDNLTQDELEILLARKRKFGFKAEELVVEYEISRLMSEGFSKEEAKRVHRISELNPSAGYDVESFNGEKKEIAHSRFIEVKASKNNQFQFHWSNNEIEVAQSLGGRYWIYFLPLFSKNKKVEDVEIIKIQDPYEKIFVQQNGYSKLVKGYLITHDNPGEIFS